MVFGQVEAAERQSNMDPGDGWIFAKLLESGQVDLNTPLGEAIKGFEGLALMYERTMLNQSGKMSLLEGIGYAVSTGMAAHYGVNSAVGMNEKQIARAQRQNPASIGVDNLEYMTAVVGREILTGLHELKSANPQSLQYLAAEIDKSDFFPEDYKIPAMKLVREIYENDSSQGKLTTEAKSWINQQIQLNLVRRIVYKAFHNTVGAKLKQNSVRLILKR